MLQPKKQTYDAEEEEEGTMNPVFIDPNAKDHHKDGIDESMDLDAIGEDEEGTLDLVEKQPWLNIPMVSEQDYRDLAQDEDGNYILLPTPKCLEVYPDILYQPSYKNWGDIKRIVVIIIALGLMGVFGSQCSPVFAAAFAAPALLWQPLLLMIFTLGVPIVLIMRALWPNIYYRVTSKTIFVVKKYAFSIGGRDMIMLNVNDVLAIEFKSSFNCPCCSVPNKGMITLHTLHAVHPELIFSVVGAFDSFYIMRDFLEEHLNKASNAVTLENQMLFPRPEESDGGLGDSLCGVICCCERSRYNISKLHATKMKRACCNVHITNVFMERVFDLTMAQNFLQTGKFWNSCCSCWCCLYCCCLCKACGGKDTPKSLSAAFPRYSGTITLHHLRQSSNNPDQYRKFNMNVPGCKEIIYRFGSDVEYQRSMAHAFKIKNLTRAAKMYRIGKGGMSMLHN